MKTHPQPTRSIFLRYATSLALLLLLLASALGVRAQVPNARADSAIAAFNQAFLLRQNNNVFYRKALNTTEADGTWTLALDIFGMQDTYEHRRTAADQALVNELCTSFLRLNPPPYTWDGWNDDLAWMGLNLARGYQITGNRSLLTQAEYCFNLAYDRGWNSTFNGGGIWEQQPDMTPADGTVSKEALANNPNGKLACLLYESTGNPAYKDKAMQLYTWSRSHLFNPLNGQVYTGIDRADVVNKSTAVYNQGSFIDFAAHLYKITSNEMLLRDAQLAANYVITNMTTNGIISNSADYLNTWADEYARGLGHLCQWNPQLWNTYYPFLKRNADVAWKNRRPDLNLSGNGWAAPTPLNPAGEPTKYVSTVALLQYTPTVQPLPGTLEAEHYNFSNDAYPRDAATTTAALRAGEWLEYLVMVPTAGLYTLTFTLAGPAPTGTLEIQQNNVLLTALAPPTAASSGSVTAAVQLSAGVQALKLRAVAGSWTIDKFGAQHCHDIVPFVILNSKPAQQTAAVTAAPGDKVQLKPTPGSGTWRWTGPNRFTSDSRVVTLNNIRPEQGGTYTATYTNEAGCVSVQDFVVTLSGCTPTPLTTTAQLNDAAPVPVDSLTVPAGSFMALEAQPDAGTWQWTGPNGFTADTRRITFLSIGYRDAGRYTVTHTNAAGCMSTRVVPITLTGADPCSSPITPYLNVNNLAWLQQDYASLQLGDRITIGPHPLDTGTWRWTGPNNFLATTREFTLTNFTAAQAGVYTAAFTNSTGCVSYRNFVLGLSSNCQPTPLIPTITINGAASSPTSPLAIHSGDNVLITFPATQGMWRWTGPNGFTAETNQVAFDQILFWRKGSYTVSLIDANACISSYTLTLDVQGNDYCGQAITPYFNVNDGAWQSEAQITVNQGDKLQIGPHPAQNMWTWTGPQGFVATTREIVLRNIRSDQAGIYHATYTNSLGCLSFQDFVVNVNHVTATPAKVLSTRARAGQQPSIYPNPALHEVMVTNMAKDDRITMYNLVGQAVSLPEPTISNGSAKLDIGRLPSGVYFITVAGASGQASYKVVKR
ncbi:T9SS type A sorting domain-containing protein [Hymenobacter sp. BT507]|uniref:T9SS type A sorting domain-containing protein n=1 Tax=Hymenobacter citatus TaxID=2763506 RepID=A0ABR7MN35_9BACT|nr:glycoside hydrolase family 76 protein [Hymenobacter citatus]MBC6612476.1 T9SS type A sorting domain-containing protein [Hymenobacter citatus]